MVLGFRMSGVCKSMEVHFFIKPLGKNNAHRDEERQPEGQWCHLTSQTQTWHQHSNAQRSSDCPSNKLQDVRIGQHKPLMILYYFKTWWP